MAGVAESKVVAVKADRVEAAMTAAVALVAVVAMKVGGWVVVVVRTAAAKSEVAPMVGFRRPGHRWRPEIWRLDNRLPLRLTVGFA